MLAVLMMVTALDADWSESELRARIKASPPEVAAYASRRIGCNYWLGERDYATIPARQAQVQQALKPLHCENIDRDERRLQRKYRFNEQLIRLLRQLHDFVP
jgi:hypothetical protein